MEMALGKGPRGCCAKTSSDLFRGSAPVLMEAPHRYIHERNFWSLCVTHICNCSMLDNKPERRCFIWACGMHALLCFGTAAHTQVQSSLKYLPKKSRKKTWELSDEFQISLEFLSCPGESAFIWQVNTWCLNTEVGILHFEGPNISRWKFLLQD